MNNDDRKNLLEDILRDYDFAEVLRERCLFELRRTKVRRATTRVVGLAASILILAGGTILIQSPLRTKRAIPAGVTVVHTEPSNTPQVISTVSEPHLLERVTEEDFLAALGSQSIALLSRAGRTEVVELAALPEVAASL